MVHSKTKILTLAEYGSFTKISEAAHILGLSQPEFWKLLQHAFRQISHQFKSETLVETRGLDSFRFTGVSGIIVLKPNVRIEVVPKFLDQADDSWRNDFLTISVLTQKGALLQNIPVNGKPTRNADLYEILIQVWLNIFESNSRYLIKTYVTTSWNDFFIDGEVEEEDLVIPSPGGFTQKGIRLSKSNEINKLLLSTANILRGRIYNSTTLSRMDRAISTLKEALKEPRESRHKVININRDHRWKNLVELSRSINDGFSLGFSDSGFASLPGFLLRTDTAWETLMQMAIKKAFPSYRVSKIGYSFGERINSRGTKGLYVYPDLSVYNAGELILIADSKYKNIRETGTDKLTITSGDIYESLAFLQATGSKQIILLYPASGSISGDPLLNQSVEKYELHDLKVIALSISVGGISGSKGFSLLSENLRKLLNHFS